MRTRSALVLTCLTAAALAGCTEQQTGSPRAGQPPEAGTSAPQSSPAPSTGGESGLEPDAIDGIKHTEYPPGLHVRASDRVAYQESAPFGGRHDQVWAACNGVVYPRAVRTENMVHSLEHGAVWIAYNPARLDRGAIKALAAKVIGKPYTMMSPYPGLDRPISLQSWGYQLKVDDPADPRIDQFITALRQNPDTTPEVGAPCDVPAGAGFDPEHPPPFDPSKPGKNAQPDQ